MTEADYAHVAEWPTHDGYTERERLAIEYAEKFALAHDTLDDDFYARLRRCVQRCRSARPHRVHRRVARARVARCTCSASTTPAEFPITSCSSRLGSPPVGDLERDTAVEGGDGRYGCRLSEDWAIWGPNGGYIASVALRAAGAHSRFDRPASIVGHYLGVAAFDLRRHRGHDAARGQAGRVDARLADAGRPARSSRRWCGGSATSRATSTTSA